MLSGIHSYHNLTTFEKTKGFGHMAKDIMNHKIVLAQLFLDILIRSGLCSGIYSKHISLNGIEGPHTKFCDLSIA